MYLTTGDNTIVIRLVATEEELANADITVYIGNTNTRLSGVAIYIDGQYIGTTNSSGFLGIDNLSLGYHSGRAEKAGYVTVTF